MDYREHLQSIEDEVNSFKSRKLSDWGGWNAWIGFYRELQQKLGTGGWDYVPNPTGGFLGFWWCHVGIGECELYLQLEYNKFCFKIHVYDKDKRNPLRSKWFNAIRAEAANKNFDVVKPARFGSGNVMTVCIADGEYRQLNADGFIDMDLTVEYFRKAEEVLKSAREKLDESA